MADRKVVTIEGNEAAAYIAHKINEVIVIYPITPSSGMGELADAFSAAGQKNIWGTVPLVAEMQSEGGAVASVHGALQTGSLSTTFTASQGLLLMIPNMYKIAGELTSTVFHVAARCIATHALSIFGDHSDVMAVRQTGFGMIASNTPQEVEDFALLSQAATLESRVPFVHFFDGFRTTNEVNRVELMSVEDIKAMIDDELVMAHRARAMSPEHPIMRGTAQNPDVYFQARETVNPFYDKTPEIVQKAMDKLAKIVGRQYHLFDYVGAPDAEKVIVLMGSGASTAHETAEFLNKQGQKVGVIKVHLFRPFSVKHFIAAIPQSVKVMAVLDRTKEPGSVGEPLYQDCVTSLSEMNRKIKVIGGRYGLSSKEFTPAMIKGIFDEMGKPEPKNHFTVGINDDVGHTSISYDPSFNIEGSDTVRAIFFGLGADGTVGANKNSIKIIGDETSNYAQGYFVYDSKKAGGITVSHLRFGPKPILQSCLIDCANFVAVHQFVFVEKYDVLEKAAQGATLLLNSPYSAAEIWDKLPKSMQTQIIEKKMKFFVIDAYKVAKETGMGVRINTVMQTCFFAISGVLPRDEAIAAIKKAIKKTYMKKGEEVVNKNYQAVDQTLANLHEVTVPAKASSSFERPPVVSPNAPAFVQNVTAMMIAGKGDDLTVSQMPVDGTFPTSTSQWEKRNIALEIPAWDPEVCIQCGRCSISCPHAAIRLKVYDAKILEKAPATFLSADAKQKDFAGMKATIQVAPEDCTGCGACIHVCPGKNKLVEGKKAINFTPLIAVRDKERINWDFFLSIPEYDRSKLNLSTVKGSQLLQPLFEFSGACAGCGETAYVKLISQLFGDRVYVSNATGCSSIYGGNLPTTPWTKNKQGRGPTWSNSLFEDNAEFGFGFRLTVEKQNEYARELVLLLKDKIGSDLVQSILDANQSDEAGLEAQRKRIDELKSKIKSDTSSQAKQLMSVADFLVKKSVWIVGGDGWAYDIGYGGLDHVLASGRNVNILVLDTEVYSNTGGQMSKSTPRGAVAKFAAAGKGMAKKDLAMIAMTYGNIYVAKVALGASDAQTVKAFVEADKYNGSSLIIAYSHCISHGIDMEKGYDNQKNAVASGHFPLLRYNPDLLLEGKNPLTLDSKAPTMTIEQFENNETRFKSLRQIDPARSAKLMELAQQDATNKYQMYEQMAKMIYTAQKA
jgi:pyruvate-ferredoxin/flavodoxin oxidoreductase